VVSVSRRELLGWLLGAPLASSACRRKVRDFPGSIRGASLSVGHKLRQIGNATLEQAPTPARRVGVAIVGAGPSGLSAAWRLEQLNEPDYLVFELERHAGGTSAYGTDGVVAYPWGAHYVPVPRPDNRALVGLLDEMGVIERDQHGGIVGKERYLVREPEERLFAAGKWHRGLFPTELSSSDDLAQLARFNREIDAWVAWRDGRGRRAFTLPVNRCSDDAEVTVLDKTSALNWLDERGLFSRRLRWYVEYACRDDYGSSLDTTSAWAMLFYFASRMSAPGVESAGFLAWPEGNGRLVKHLSQPLGARLQTGQIVTDILPSEAGVQVCALDTERGTLTRYLAEHVILAVPKFIVPRVLRPWRDRPPPHIAAFSYGAWLVANLHLRHRPKSVGQELAWDNVIFDSPSLGYVAATHQQLADYGPTILTYYRPFLDKDPDAARRRLAELTHSDFCDAIMTDLGRAHRDLDEAIERIDVWRWGHAMVRPTPGFVWSAARKKAAEPFGRVHFAHSDLSGLALFEEAQDRGIYAAEAVLRARGRSFEALAALPA